MTHPCLCQLTLHKGAKRITFHCNGIHHTCSKFFDFLKYLDVAMLCSQRVTCIGCLDSQITNASLVFHTKNPSKHLHKTLQKPLLRLFLLISVMLRFYYFWQCVKSIILRGSPKLIQSVFAVHSHIAFTFVVRIWKIGMTSPSPSSPSPSLPAPSSSSSPSSP